MPEFKDPGPIEFDAAIQSTGKWSYVEFLFDVTEVFGVKGRVPVKATFDGVPYRGSMVRMGTECHLIGLLKAIQADISKAAGDTVHVTVSLDTEKREVTLPTDAQTALADAGIAADFGRLPYSHQREYAMAIEEAKRPETRQRRIEAMVEAVRGKAK